MIAKTDYRQILTKPTGQVENRYEKIAGQLADYEPICLAELNRSTLLNRVDTKYVMHFEHLSQVLDSLSESYWLLDTNQKKPNHYRTLYFDTEQFTLYQQHHNHMRNRYKVRCREYVDTQVSFLEIKKKTNQNRTIKHRMQIPRIQTSFSASMWSFLRMHYPGDAVALQPCLWNEFYRITLVSKQHTERLTLDFNLQFSFAKRTIRLPEIVIAEVKQEKFSMKSDFIHLIRDLGVRPHRFSKYCMGIPRLHADIKNNNFKTRDLLISKISKKGVQNGFAYSIFA